MLSPVKALLDANVLYSNHLRNLLLQLAQNGVMRWSDLIEQEWLRNMEPRTRKRIAARQFHSSGFPDALVDNFDPEQVIGATR